MLKGPHGALYGRNTSGGAINFISAKPSAETSADLTASYASFGTTKIEGALGGAIAGDLAGRLAFVKNDSNGSVLNALSCTCG